MRSTLNLAKDLFNMENPLQHTNVRKIIMQLKWALRQLLFKNSITPSVNANILDVGFQSTSLFEFRSEIRKMNEANQEPRDENDCEQRFSLIDSITAFDFLQNVLYYRICAKKKL
ncbi:hypothetical protein ILUMI_19821 [Ignelater luminosus]|uniref:Uncharacterized protein n=1 Tax=Ignelater luminosus TaxID=2038154 RepID=A0A8K0CJE4_IGNLU|nr:hypothetical protein ILUMI_19821 [Ignelater luminosus]